MRSLIAHPILLLGVLLLLAACGGGSTAPGGSLSHGTYPVPDGPGALPPGAPPDDGGTGGTPSIPGLSGGVLVTVDTRGETWRWWVTNPVTASYLERRWNGTYTGRFWGRLRATSGEAGHNDPWSWHLDPEQNGYDIVFFAPPGAGPTSPSDCENQLSHWLTQDTLYIPYPFTIVAFEDLRD